jgi:hypothetical protein
MTNISLAARGLDLATCWAWVKSKKDPGSAQALAYERDESYI